MAAKKKTTAKKSTTKKTAAKKTTKKAATKKTTKKAPAKKAAAKKTATKKTATTAPTAVTTPAAAPAAGKQDASQFAPGVIDEAVLNWTDLTGAKTGAATFGSNKFYKGQIAEDAGGGFVVRFEWGRVGAPRPQTSQTRCTTLDAARRTFESKINAKIAKGYTRLEMRSQAEEVAKAKAKGVEVGDKKKAPKKKAGPSRTFHPEVSALLKIMYSATGDAIRKGLSSSAGASESAPLGNLSDHQLDVGAEILERVEGLVQKGKAKRPKLIELTNEYLSNIPRNIDSARSGGRLDLDAILLDSQDRIDEQRKFITLLRDAHLQKEVFAEAAESDDPVEVWYDGLNCALDYVEPNTPEWKKLAKLFEDGQSPMNSNFYNKLKVGRIWSLERNKKKPHFDDYAETVIHKKDATGLVHGWHGTRTENLMGISRSGLLMPENLPKGVHITGKAFGKGIYHAPRWDDAGKPRKAEDGKTYKRYNGALKSMNYTSMSGAFYGTGNTGKAGFLFLEQVALGVPEVHLTACWDRPRPAKGHDYIYARAFGNPQLSHDEIVTFDENASRLTHLMEILFK